MSNTIKIKYKKNKHQAEFHRDIKTRRLHLSTGFGGGKTYAVCQKAIQLSWLNRHIPGGMVQGTFADFKKDWLPLMEEILDQNGINYEYKQSGKYGPFFKFPWSNAPAYIASAEKKIRGPNWGWATINELTLFPLVRYKEVMGRVRIKKAPFPQIASCGTPEGWASEYYEYLVEKPPRNTRIIYGSSKDNQDNLDEEYIDDLYETYDSKMQAAFIDGEWVNMAGDLFYYSYNPKINDDPTTEDNEWDNVHISIDFNVSPMIAEVWQYDGMQLIGIDELVIEDNARTYNMCSLLDESGYGPKRAFVYPDPSGKSRKTTGDPDIKVMEDYGYVVRKKKKAPTFRERQINTNNLLEKARVIINPKKQPRLKKDFLGVALDSIRLEKDKSNTSLTHASDGFDYITDILMPFKGHRNIQLSTRRIR